MIEKAPFKLLIIALIALILIWVVFSGGGDAPINGNDLSDEYSSESAVSAITPITDQSELNSLDGKSGVIRGSFVSSPSLTAEENRVLKTLFEQARDAQDQDKAILLYDDLIKQFPSSIEPHLNLANIYASQGNLEKARETLLHGFEKNPKAQLLFNSLQEVHGALAASAYAKSLDTNADVSSSVKLPRATSLVTRLDQEAKIQSLEEQVLSLSSTQTASNQTQPLDDNLREELADAQTQLKELKVAHQTELVALKNQLAETNQSLLSSVEAEREALARVVRIEQESSLQVSQAGTLAAESLDEQQVQKIESLEQELALVKTQLANANASLVAASETMASDAQANASSETGNTEQTDNNTVLNESQAKELVSNWARSWSAQDVDAYVSFYANNYTSSSSVSRSQWLTQRQQRLTNKKFINVQVSDFRVKDLDRQFSVTFKQSYKSNTVDDTVTKRLIFNKQGSSWSNAKIINESIISS